MCLIVPKLFIFVVVIVVVVAVILLLFWGRAGLCICCKFNGRMKEATAICCLQ